MRLSLCINTFNEEKNIHIPLDSAIDLVDEVVIIDGSSKDKTVEIAKSYGPKVKVFIVDNPRNFLANKQRAIEKANGEWILQLDSDEALSEDLKKEILSLLQVQSSLRPELRARAKFNGFDSAHHCPEQSRTDKVQSFYFIH